MKTPEVGTTVLTTLPGWHMQDYGMQIFHA